MVVLALLLVGLQPAPLSSSHRSWLEEEVHFLLSSEEHERFLELGSDEERERFIDAFWIGRDRAEHARRLRDSDRLFGPRGRFSDRGRFYQLLGRPSFREDYARAGHRLVPTELWHYTGVSVSFLPDSFYLIFFRPGASGDYRLWSPTADGIAALVSVAEPGQLLLEPDAAEELELVDPELALAVRELVPGGGPLRAQLLIVNLERFVELRERDRAFSARVRTDASVQVLPAQLMAAVFRDDASVPELHYAIELEPDENPRLPWRRVGDRWCTRFTILGRLTGPAAEELERWQDTLQIDLTDEERERLHGTPLSFQGRRLLPSGAERFEASLVSENGAFAVLEQEIGTSDLAPLLLARSSEEGAHRGRLPFLVSGMLLSPRAARDVRERSVIALTQLASGEAESVQWEVWRNGQLVSKEERTIDATKLATERIVFDAAPARYRVLVSHRATSRELRFDARPEPGPSPVRVLAREPTPDEERRYRIARARAFAQQGELSRAIEAMEAVVALGEDDVQAHLDLARLNYSARRYSQVLDRLDAVQAKFERDVDLFVLMAAAAEALGSMEKAATYYEKALSLDPENVELRRTLERLRASLH